MEMYVQFLFTLSIGLIGLGVTMTTLFDTVLRDWDPSQDLRRWWRGVGHPRHAAAIRAEDILQQLEAQHGMAFSSIAIDRLGRDPSGPAGALPRS